MTTIHLHPAAGSILRIAHTGAEATIHFDHAQEAAAPIPPRATERPRFVKLSGSGQELPLTADDYAAVLDTRQGLLWSAATLPDRMNWKAAQKACAELRVLDHSDWRLPTYHELTGLIDIGRYNPAIDTRYFPNTKAEAYWTSSPGASVPSDYAWIVNFHYGYAYIYNQNYAAFVRAVRSVAPPSGQ